MTKFYIYKGDRASDGARNLANNLDAVLMKAQGSAYRGRPGSAVINWGSHNDEARRLEGIAPVFLNSTTAVRRASNKLSFLEVMAAAHPELVMPFVRTYDAAMELIAAGGRVYARTTLNGHSGEGIHLMMGMNDADLKSVRTMRQNNIVPIHIAGADLPTDELRGAKLFTQGIAGKRTEYRVHVFQGRAILTQVKLRRADAQEQPGYNSLIRNLASGWIYGVNLEGQPGINTVQAAAIAALRASQLDFGAVDIVYKEDTQRPYVLEINTAPGLGEDGSSLRAYTEAFANV